MTPNRWRRVVVAVLPFILWATNANAQTTNQQIPGCKDIAPMPPVLTFGGPATVRAGSTELAIAAGAWGNLFPGPCLHETGVNWFGRWRRGLTDRLDVGFDFQETEHSSNQDLSFKAAVRYKLLKDLRLEGGFGIGDDTEGKSINTDVAATLGMPFSNATWSTYAAIRLAAARGYSSRAFAGSNTPPGAVVPIASFGTSARVGENATWTFEGGGGGILSREHPDVGEFVYIAVGLNFTIHRKAQ
jgi:hypothetical protein